eukprot:3505009-Rhodomonas_salina.1
MASCGSESESVGAFSPTLSRSKLPRTKESLGKEMVASSGRKRLEAGWPIRSVPPTSMSEGIASVS